MNLPRRAFLAGLLTLAVATPVLAQGQFGILPMSNPGEGIPLGPMLFSPSLQAAWLSQDNLFRTPVDPVADDLYIARGNFIFELPIHESMLRCAYRPEYRDYKDFQLQQNWSHFLDLIGRFEFSNGMVINAVYRFVDASQQIREVDPGNELTFGNRPFRRNSLSVGVDYWITARDGFTVVADVNNVAYKDPLTEPSPDPDEPQFYDFTRSSAGVGWLHQLNSVLVMDVTYRRIWFDPVDTFAWRTSTSDQVTAGFRGLLSPVVSTELRVGWRQTQYDEFLGEQVLEDYSKWIINGFVNWDMGHGSTLDLTLRRENMPSAYGLNAYFDLSRAVLTYNYDRDRFFALARARFQVNDYQVEDVVTGESRRDDINSYTAGLGYRFTRIFSLYGSYIHESRDSTIARYGYDANVLTVGV